MSRKQGTPGNIPDHIQEHTPDDVLSFADQVEAEFLRLYEAYRVADAPARQIPNKIDAIWAAIYDTVFKPGPEDIRYNNAKSKLKTWDIDNIEAVLKKYIELNRVYGGVIKHGPFEDMTGFTKQTIHNWHKDNNTPGYIFPLSDNAIQTEYNNVFLYTHHGETVEYSGNNRYVYDKTNGILSYLRFDIWKKIQESMQDSNTNGLALDTMGSMYRANQEPELGRMYEPKRAIYQEQARRMLSAADLVKPEELPGSDTQFSGGRLDILD